MQRLTPRERQIVKLLATGKSQNQIACALGISVGTVYNITNNVRRLTKLTTEEIRLKAAREMNA